MEKFWYKKAEFSDVPVLIEASMKELLEDFHWDINMQKKFKENYEESIPRLMKEETLVFYLLYQESTFVGMARMYVWKEDIAKGEATLSGIYILPNLCSCSRFLLTTVFITVQFLFLASFTNISNKC